MGMRLADVLVGPAGEIKFPFGGDGRSEFAPSSRPFPPPREIGWLPREGGRSLRIRLTTGRGGWSGDNFLH